MNGSVARSVPGKSVKERDRTMPLTDSVENRSHPDIVLAIILASYLVIVLYITITITAITAGPVMFGSALVMIIMLFVRPGTVRGNQDLPENPNH